MPANARDSFHVTQSSRWGDCIGAPHWCQRSTCPHDSDPFPEPKPLRARRCVALPGRGKRRCNACQAVIMKTPSTTMQDGSLSTQASAPGDGLKTADDVAALDPAPVIGLPGEFP